MCHRYQPTYSRPAAPDRPTSLEALVFLVYLDFLEQVAKKAGAKGIASALIVCYGLCPNRGLSPNRWLRPLMGLAAVEVGVDELLKLFGVVLHVFAQGGVVEVAQLLDDSVDHSGAEHIIFFKDGAHFLEAVG